MTTENRRDLQAALFVLGLGLAILLGAAALHAQPDVARTADATPERCTSEGGDAAALLSRALDATGARALDGARLHVRYTDVVSHRYESDRMYAPSLTYAHTGELWLDPATGVQRVEEQMAGAGGSYRMPPLLGDARATFAARGDSLMPMPQAHQGAQRRRALDPWAVLTEWRDAAAAGAVRVAGRCLYRERWRTVVARAAAPGGFTVGDERLYLDRRSGLPVKLDRRERDALWGAVRAEYVFTNWELIGGRAPRYPIAVARLVDGAVDVARTVSGVRLVRADSAPRLALAESAPMPTWREPSDAPDTVRVGPNAFLLSARSYTSAVVLARDTVVVLDATIGEARARQDSAWIARLFPGRHPVKVVVSDLAWPHLSGVRFWVARGATIVSHRDSRPFLEEIVARRWTDTPDALERARAANPAAARLRFVAVADSAGVGGDVRLLSIDGLGSEGALAAYLPDAHFLWAGDYVQSVRGPTTYAAEVIAAAARHGVAPERVAAMHLPVTPWGTVVTAQRP